MSYYVAKLNRPYNVHTLIKTYVYTKRSDFIHEDFSNYYGALLPVLANLLGVDFSVQTLSNEKRMFWGLFQGTVSSLLQITSPWAGYLEESLLVKRLDESGGLGLRVHRASTIIMEANSQSEAAHRDMLHALFELVFGECRSVVTSAQLAAAGVDDSKEPDITDYYDFL